MEKVSSQIHIVFGKIPSDIVKLAWQLLSLGADQSSAAVLDSCCSHTLSSPWGTGCCQVTRLPALPVGKSTAAEALWRGLTIALISLKHSCPYIAQRKEDLTAQTLQIVL